MPSGTFPGIAGLPNEQIGYMASEEYASKINTAHTPTGYHHKAHSNHSQPHVESPLRKASFPVETEGKNTFDRSILQNKTDRESTDNALESETEDEKYHVDPPAHRNHKITGNGYDPPTEDLGPEGGNTESRGGFIEETGYGVSHETCSAHICKHRITSFGTFSRIICSYYSSRKVH